MIARATVATTSRDRPSPSISRPHDLLLAAVVASLARAFDGRDETNLSLWRQGVDAGADCPDPDDPGDTTPSHVVMGRAGCVSSRSHVVMGRTGCISRESRGDGKGGVY